MALMYVASALIQRTLQFGHSYLLITCLLAYLLTHLLTHSLACLLLTYSLTYSLAYLLTHLLTHSLTYSLAYSLACLLLTYSLTYLLTYHVLTPCYRVLEKPTDSQLVKKFPTFYATRRFITAFTSARHLSLS